MIYLIDDNKYGQMSENYKVDFAMVLKEFPSQIIWKEKFEVSELEYVISHASCILIHDSVYDKETKEFLIAQAKKRDIPYCIFSNGFSGTIFENASIKEIKKDRLYNNLLAFINYFIKEGKIDLKLLSLGENYNLEKALIIQDRLINGTLLTHKNNFMYENAFPSGSSAYKDLKELVYLSNPETDFSTFEEVYNSKETTAQSMRANIIEMVKDVKRKHEQ